MNPNPLHPPELTKLGTPPLLPGSSALNLGLVHIPTGRQTSEISAQPGIACSGESQDVLTGTLAS